MALGLSYSGTSYCGWQSQPGGCGVQDHLERALGQFLGSAPPRTACAGRTDARVHALGQVVHFDSPLQREAQSWVRGVNAFLPRDMAVQWARTGLSPAFDARRSAFQRRYRYVLRHHPVRPALDEGRVGWTHRPLDLDRLRAAAQTLLGEHDFSAFRSSECQARSPVKTLHAIDIERHGDYVVFDLRANAFLHHMVRNIVGSLLAVGNGSKSLSWLADVLASRDRRLAAPTFMPDGLYFLGPDYPAEFGLPSPPDHIGLLF
ncbi:tRNA pseudouridine(38-40) synthase [Thiomonas bhubaneswarensis]|uniref:tRNA pseudouridine synthase A n=1 Tax=Thiomonas bhubaneswarensis TaxID=339866 RepID=A0A0K6I3I1_9BURK|nr:tRNA pseudouridine(38-40) synthase [Thiomonas bhubaneswarensis]